MLLQLSVTGLAKPTSAYKVYQTMFRVIKESETVDARQHCFLLQSSPPHTTPRYLSVETRIELLRIENSWNSTIITSVIKLGVSTLFQYLFRKYHIRKIYITTNNYIYATAPIIKLYINIRFILRCFRLL